MLSLAVSSSLQDLVLRLNSQSRPAAEVLPEVLPICSLDAATGKPNVPPLERLKAYRVIVTTCGASHLLLEAGGARLPTIRTHPLASAPLR